MAFAALRRSLSTAAVAPAAVDRVGATLGRIAHGMSPPTAPIEIASASGCRVTTADGDVVHVVGRASGQSGGPSSPMRARGAFHFQTNSDKLSRLNSLAGVFEYDIDPDGSSKGKIWEWT